MVFSKEYKLSRLKKFGNWNKVVLSSKISARLKHRLSRDEITSAFQLENHNIYYFNHKDQPKYKKATMVIFGLSQYGYRDIPHQLIEKILELLGDISNIDICYDLDRQPNIAALTNEFGKPINYKGFSQTFYFNRTDIPLIEKFVVYNKSLKDNLEGILYRIEFKVLIHNIKDLYLPIDEIMEIIALAHSR